MVTYDRGLEESYRSLCNQIIIQAISDYVMYSKELWRVNTDSRLLEYRDKVARRYMAEMNKIKKFFFSDWFCTLCNIDSEIVWVNTVKRAEKAVQALEAKKLKEEAKHEKEKGKQAG